MQSLKRFDALSVQRQVFRPSAVARFGFINVLFFTAAEKMGFVHGGGGRGGRRRRRKAVDGQNFQQTASTELRQEEQIVFLTANTIRFCAGTTCPFLVVVVSLSVEHSTQSFTHPSSTFSWVRRFHLLAVVVPPWVVHSTQSGQNVDFIRSQYAIRRGNSSAKMETSSLQSTRENGNQQFTDYQQGKMETSSLQTINRGKGKPAVYRLSTQENGNQQFTNYQQGKRETSSLQTINKGKGKPVVYKLSTREKGNQ